MSETDRDYRMAYINLKSTVVGVRVCLEHALAYSPPESFILAVKDSLEIITNGIREAEEQFAPKLIDTPKEEEMERE